MKLTNRRIVNDANMISNIANKELPVKVSYALSKNISKIENELKIYNTERQKLLDKYCIKDENGKLKIDENNNLKISDEFTEVWEKEFQELQNIEVEIDIHRFKLDELADYKITPVELMAIDYMIEE
ncbi:Uncharacterised protein [[Clostridium] sordellii]|uniref:DUF1617 family protein n=1 Tax=Paraclostridium sordellii TaxID=1505 RepID=UPI0005DC2AA2|nr:DUF1617 family protein [Paeniclostridium sordellii]CEQ08613.1 Uncharacterised protein [[Clostridium] sordellii] [Paeniclostridium sordellii]